MISISMEFLAADENTPVASNHCRPRSRSENPKGSDENLNCSLICSDDLYDGSDYVACEIDLKVTPRLASLSLGSIKLPRSGVDDNDILSTTRGEKHDFDWLLTPPGTPLAKEFKSAAESPKPISRGRPLSTRKASRLSVPLVETKHSSIPSRSTSVTRRPSISASILNTTSPSLSSKSTPSSPLTHSPTTTTPSSPFSCSTLSRSSTPSKLRSSPSSCSFKKTKPNQNARPLTPTSNKSHNHSPVNSSATSSLSNIHSSTPPPPRGKSTASIGRSLSNGRLPASGIRTPSPVTRTLAPQQPLVLPQKSPRVSQNLKRVVPSRSVSAGRIKPGAMKVTSEAVAVVNTKRRNHSPVLDRRRLVEAPGKSRANSTGHAADRPDSRKAPNVSNTASRKSGETLESGKEGARSGRTVLKSSLEMAIRHLGMKNGKRSSRLFSSAVYPHSVRSATCNVDSVGSSKGSLQGEQVSETPDEATYGKSLAKLSETDIFESSRFEYDMLLLKEDVKNANWLHSIDDLSDQGIDFDSGFESLPELFDPLQ